MVGIIGLFLAVILLTVGCSSKEHTDQQSVPNIDPSTASEMNRQAEPAAITDPFIIVLDAGHGGNDSGAIGASGQLEKTFTLSLVQKVYDILLLDPLFEPHMTRTDDTYVEIAERAAIANRLNADVLISIHGNTFTDPEVGGTETYYYAEDSIRLAEVIHENIMKEVMFRDRDIKQERWQVIADSEGPAILAEIGYLTNAEEESTMLREDWQDRTAQAIVEGIYAYFGINEW